MRLRCLWSPAAKQGGRRADLLQGLLDVGGGDVEAVVRRQLVGIAPEVLVAHAPPLGRVGRARVDVQAAACRSFSETVSLPLQSHVTIVHGTIRR